MKLHVKPTSKNWSSCKIMRSDVQNVYIIPISDTRYVNWKVSLVSVFSGFTYVYSPQVHSPEKQKKREKKSNGKQKKRQK